MDWPLRFFLPINKDWITGKMFRGIACRCPEQSRTPGADLADKIDAVTGRRFSDDDVSLSVILKPHRIIGAQAAGVMLSAQPGVQYYIHSAWIAAELAGTDTGTLAYIGAYFQKASKSIAYLGTNPLAAAVYNPQPFILDVLTDVNQPVTFFVTGTMTVSVAAVIYSEVTVGSS